MKFYEYLATEYNKSQLQAKSVSQLGNDKWN